MNEQPTIVIAAADPDRAFSLQARLREALGWDYAFLITFTAPQALEYVVRRSALLLISAPRMARKAYVMDVPELLEAIRERASATRVLLDEGQPLGELAATACQALGLPAA